MASTWSPERRKRQSELIQSWKPWQKSTGPRTAEGKATAAQNAFRGALWSQVRALERRTTTLIRALKAAGNWPPAF